MASNSPSNQPFMPASGTKGSADPKAEQLISAIAQDNRQDAQTLLSAGVDANAVGSEGAPPLIVAMVLPPQRPDASAASAGSRSELERCRRKISRALAAGADDPELLQILLDNGGNANGKGPEGEPVTFVAANELRPENIRLLLAHGADRDARDGKGNTLLLKLAMLRQFSVVKMLLEQGADSAIANQQGLTLKEVANSIRMNEQSQEAQHRQEVVRLLGL